MSLDKAIQSGKEHRKSYYDRDVFEDARAQDDYGNGRFVRNMLERARMTQASRIAKMNYDSIKKSDLENIMPEDIRVPEVSKKGKEL